MILSMSSKPVANDQAQEQEPQRVTIDLSPAAASEVRRLQSVTGLKKVDLFRYALSLLTIYVDAKARGERVRILNPSDKSLQTEILIPITVLSGREDP